MKQEMMTITSQRQLAPKIFEMTLTGELVREMTKPGQFLHLKVPRADLLLRRPISLNQIDQKNQTCTVIYRTEGAGTKAFAQMVVGEKIDVMGPLGNGYDLSDVAKGDTAYLVGGGIGIPPLYELSKQLVAKGVQVVHFLGFATKEVVYYAEEFQALGKTYLATDDGSLGTAGNVGTLLQNAEQPDVIFACGNNGMLKAVEQHFPELDNIQLSLESRMACGMGACYACVVHLVDDKTGMKSAKVCEDGPVFQAGKVVY